MKTYSVAEARRQLPKLLHDVEDGESVEITRHGKAVAVVVPLDRFRQLVASPPDFGEAYARWRSTVSDADLELPEDYFDSLRDRSAGRAVDL